MRFGSVFRTFERRSYPNRRRTSATAALAHALRQLALGDLLCSHRVHFSTTPLLVRVANPYGHDIAQNWQPMHLTCRLCTVPSPSLCEAPVGHTFTHWVRGAGTASAGSKDKNLHPGTFLYSYSARCVKTPKSRPAQSPRLCMRQRRRDPTHRFKSVTIALPSWPGLPLPSSSYVGSHSLGKTYILKHRG